MDLEYDDFILAGRHYISANQGKGFTFTVGAKSGKSHTNHTGGACAHSRSLTPFLKHEATRSSNCFTPPIRGMIIIITHIYSALV